MIVRLVFAFLTLTLSYFPSLPLSIFLHSCIECRFRNILFLFQSFSFPFPSLSLFFSFFLVLLFYVEREQKKTCLSCNELELFYAQFWLAFLYRFHFFSISFPLHFFLFSFPGLIYSMKKNLWTNKRGKKEDNKILSHSSFFSSPSGIQCKFFLSSWFQIRPRSFSFYISEVLPEKGTVPLKKYQDWSFSWVAFNNNQTFCAFVCFIFFDFLMRIMILWDKTTKNITNSGRYKIKKEKKLLLHGRICRWQEFEIKLQEIFYFFFLFLMKKKEKTTHYNNSLLLLLLDFIHFLLFFVVVFSFLYFWRRKGKTCRRRYSWSFTKICQTFHFLLVFVVLVFTVFAFVTHGGYSVMFSLLFLLFSAHLDIALFLQQLSLFFTIWFWVLSRLSLAVLIVSGSKKKKRKRKRKVLIWKILWVYNWPVDLLIVINRSTTTSNKSLSLSLSLSQQADA